MDMHNVNKRLYAAPTTKLIQVETESAICGGSVDIANPNNEDYGRINNQEVNDEFMGGQSFDGGWTTPEKQ